MTIDIDFFKHLDLSQMDSKENMNMAKQVFTAMTMMHGYQVYDQWCYSVV